MRKFSNTVTLRLANCARALAFITAIGAVTPAFAAEDAVVEALIQRGIQLRRNSADEDALAVFLEAERQDPTSVRVLLHIVTAAQAAGKWLMADSYVRKVSALSEDPYYRRHSEAIEVVRRAIAARVGTFLAQGGPDGASVRLDGQLVGTLPMEEPTSVEAGAYLMEVHKPGFYRLRRNVTISGGVLTREPVELNRAVARGDVGAGAGTAGLAGADGSGGVEGDAANRAWWTAPAVGWTLVGVGMASGVVSGISFVMREQSASRWNDENRCVRNDGSTREETCPSDKDQAETAQTLGVITGIAGVALVGLGVTHLLTVGSGASSHSDASAHAGPTLTGCDAGLLSIACSGTF
jgi:PEGA domain-containing protein